MADGVACKAMPDEPSWGQFVRLAKLRGLRTRESLGSLIPPEALIEGWKLFDLRRHVVRSMSGARTSGELSDYFDLHCIAPLLLGWSHWTKHDKRVGYTWSFHHSRFYPSPVVVRSCADCVQEEVDQFGFAWFKRSHQLPGVNWCGRHLSFLCERRTAIDILRCNAWVTLWPSSAPVRSATMPPFVGRYSRVLAWLGSPAGKRKWHEMSKTLTRTLCEEGELEMEYAAAHDRIAREAPEDWYETNFLLPWNRSTRPNYPPQEDDAPRMALLAAAIARSDQDVDSLLGRAVSLAKEKNDRLRRWIKGEVIGQGTSTDAVEQLGRSLAIIPRAE